MNPNMQQTLLEQGKALARSDAPQAATQALALFDQILSANPTHVQALIEKAQLLAYLRSWDAASATAARILQLAPNNPKALRVLAVYNWEKRNFDLALQQLEQVIAQEPNDDTLYTLKGGILRNKFAFDRNPAYLDQAIAAFDRALQLNPGDRDTIAARNETMAVKRSRSGFNDSRFWTIVWMVGWGIAIVGETAISQGISGPAQVFLGIPVALPLLVGWVMTIVRSFQEKRWGFAIFVLAIGNMIAPLVVIFLVYRFLSNPSRS